MWEMTDFLRVFCSTEHLSLHVILAIKGWFCSERCQSGLAVKNRVWQPSYLQINKLPIFPFLSIRCDRNQSRDIQPARQLANLASWEQRMLISFGSCENPSRPGNYDTSEICRSIAWSNTMIFRLIMPDYYHFFFFLQQSLPLWTTKSLFWLVILAGKVWVHHSQAGLTAGEVSGPGGDPCCLPSCAVAHTNCENHGYKREHAALCPPEFMLLLDKKVSRQLHINADVPFLVAIFSPCLEARSPASCRALLYLRLAAARPGASPAAACSCSFAATCALHAGHSSFAA